MRIGVPGGHRDGESALGWLTNERVGHFEGADLGEICSGASENLHFLLEVVIVAT